MKNKYVILSTFMYLGCHASHWEPQKGVVLEDTAIQNSDTGSNFYENDTGKTDTGDNEKETGLYDTHVLETGDDSSQGDTSLESGVYDSGRGDSGIYDSGSFDSGVYDSGSLDSGLRDSSDTGSSAAERWCTATVVPESVPTEQLLPNRYALVDEDEYFETNTGSRSSPVLEDSLFMISDTYGCSCERILDCKPSEKTNEEYAAGCTKGTMNDWIDQRAWATECLK